MDHLLWECQYARFVWNGFFQEFDFALARKRDVCLMIRVFLHHLPLKESFFFFCMWRCA